MFQLLQFCSVKSWPAGFCHLARCRRDVQRQDRPDEAVVSPTLCPPHRSGDSDVTDVSAAADGIVNLWPLFPSGVHPCCPCVLCLVVAGKSGGVCADDCDVSGGLSGKQSFINRSLTGVGRSGSCLQSEVLMASPTPCILSSSFAFPLQKNVYPPYGSAIEPSSPSLDSLRAAMTIWYLPTSLAMREVLLQASKRHPGPGGCARSMRRKSYCCCCC